MRFTCETATLTDAVQRAARVAPTKGDAWDKAGGIQIELVGKTVVLRATDLQVTYLQRVSTDGAPDDDGETIWRLEASLLSRFMATLPMGEGSRVTLSDTDNSRVLLECGLTTATFTRIMGDSFPQWDAFHPADLVDVPDLAFRLKQVAWAVDRDSAPLDGIHINGKELIGCDRAKMAFAACDVPVDEPITVPMSSVASAIRDSGALAMRVEDDKLLVMPDEDTQVTSVVYAQPYPDVGRVRDLVANAPHETKLPILATLNVLQRAMTMCQGERYPLARFTFIDASSLQVTIDVPELGVVEDYVEIDGGPDEEFIIWFTPDNIVNALTQCGGNTATLRFGPTNMSPFEIKGDNGVFECVIMPRKVGGTP